MSAATHDEPVGEGPGRVAPARFAGALMFPGQGSQRIGMGRWMERTSPAAAEVFDVAGEVLGRDVRALCFTGPARELTLTRNAQVAVFTTNAAAAAVLAAEGFEARLALGHSVGELNALVAAGVLPLDDGLRLVAARGEIMGRIPVPGTMAALVGLDQDVVRELCAAASGEPSGPAGTAGVVVPALLNGPQNVVVSGDVAAVELCTGLAVEAGARSITKLVVSGAFHSPLMAAAVAEWSEVVAAAALREPRIPVVLNTTGAVATGADDVRRALVDQLTGPVRWVEDVRTAVGLLGRLDGGLLMESGDSKVLTTLARGIEPDAATMTMHDPKTLRRLRGETPARQPRPQLAARW
jgi:[acyl-carrier-protein] S-malonyltransferase